MQKARVFQERFFQMCRRVFHTVPNFKPPPRSLCEDDAPRQTSFIASRAVAQSPIAFPFLSHLRKCNTEFNVARHIPNDHAKSKHRENRPREPSEPKSQRVSGMNFVKMKPPLRSAGFGNEFSQNNAPKVNMFPRCVHWYYDICSVHSCIVSSSFHFMIC